MDFVLDFCYGTISRMVLCEEASSHQPDIYMTYPLLTPHGLRSAPPGVHPRSTGGLAGSAPPQQGSPWGAKGGSQLKSGW